MQFITLILQDSEWARIAAAAAIYWPGIEIDREMSRAEASRRLLLSGLDLLKQAQQAQRKAILDSHASPLQPPPDRSTPVRPR